MPFCIFAMQLLHSQKGKRNKSRDDRNHNHRTAVKAIIQLRKV